MSESVPHPEWIECSECGREMASVWTDFSAVAWPFRYECVAGPVSGPVEVRGEESIAANSPLKEYHGDATAPVKE